MNGVWAVCDQNETGVWTVCEQCMTDIWAVCERYAMAYERRVTSVWSACDQCVTSVWPVCDWCVSGVWLVCERCVTGVWLVCDWCVTGVLPSCYRCVLTVFEQYDMHVNGWIIPSVVPDRSISLLHGGLRVCVWFLFLRHNQREIKWEKLSGRPLLGAHQVIVHKTVNQSFKPVSTNFDIK